MDIQAMMAAMGDGETADKMKAIKERTEKVKAIVLPEGEGQRMHDMSIRWTMLEVYDYASSVLSHRMTDEVAEKAATLIRELTDFLIENQKIRGSDKVPGISYFKTLTDCKAGSVDE